MENQIQINVFIKDETGKQKIVNVNPDATLQNLIDIVQLVHLINNNWIKDLVRNRVDRQ